MRVTLLSVETFVIVSATDRGARKNMREAQNVFLIGLMGAGKTTIGQLLAKRLGYSFVDSDHVLEHRTGVSVATIFEIEGETAFRAREAAVIDELSQRSAIVLGTGGGAIGSAETRERLRARGTVVYLHTTPEVAFQRVRRSTDRPLLKVADPLARLTELYSVRHPLYLATCHLEIESHRDKPSAVVSEIAAMLTG
jgi:shikimate kinase